MEAHKSGFWHQVIARWKGHLQGLLNYYIEKRKTMHFFFPKLFVFFILVNLTCYWVAMFTAFPELCHGEPGWHYLKVSFPVGFLGALFDSLSFFVTIYIVKRALTRSAIIDYVGHLSIDLLIAVLATFWVLFVFSFSGWLIHSLDEQGKAGQSLKFRQERYETMLIEAVEKPTENKRNIYFGFIMGVSAGLPTFIHLVMFMKSFVSVTRNKKKLPESQAP